MQYEIKEFNEKQIRTVFNEEENEWYFSVIDVIGAITESKDPSQYLKRAKSRNQSLATFTGTSCTREALLTVQGMKRTTSVISKRNLSQFLSYFSSEKKEEFSTWLESNFPTIEKIESQNSAYLLQKSNIRNLIYTIRNTQVMFDSDIAMLYQVDTKRINEAVKRNPERFPHPFCFKLTLDELNNLKSQIATSSLQPFDSDTHGGRRKLPSVFDEHGILMLATILHSDIAIKMSVEIINEFVDMRHFLQDNNLLLSKVDSLEKQQKIFSEFKIDASLKLDTLLEYMHKHEAPIEFTFLEDTFYDGVSIITQFIQSASKEIILIDNYANNQTLDLLSKKKRDVLITLITHPKTSLTQTDIDSFNKQFTNLQLYESKSFHDRYLILDRCVYFDVGSSIKDVGKNISTIRQLSKPSEIEKINNQLNAVLKEDKKL